MPQPKELNERMTMNIQDWKKEKLIAIAAEKRISYSKLLLSIVDGWMAQQNGISDAGQD